MNLVAGNAFVQTTTGRGHTPEEVAKMAVDKIISISIHTDPALREQAIGFKDAIEKVITLYMKQAIRSDRTTIYNALVNAGHPQLAEQIRRI